MNIYQMENIRCVEYNNEKWYALTDISDFLGMKRISRVFNTEKYRKILKMQTKKGKQNIVAVNIHGVKQVLQSSRSINKEKLITYLNIDMNIIFDCKESYYLKIISLSFKSFKQNFQYDVDGYRIDLYFPDYNLAIEVDEFNHIDRNKVDDMIREKHITQKLGCKFIRFNPDEKNFNIGDIISNILENTLML
jgi:very-short-patch-repair endonuclease